MAELTKKHFDQHIHSAFSYDAVPDTRGAEPDTAAFGRIVDTAVSRGLSGIAITDHLDPLWPDDEYPSYLNVTEYEKALTDAAPAFSEKLMFSKGIELGLVPGEALDICAEAVSSFNYDFVIGSVHSSRTAPIDYPEFIEGRALPDIVDEYYTLIYDCMKAYKDYDVLGHINSIDRYTDGLAPESLYMPYVDEILKLAVSDGKGIEINTSSFGRYNRIIDRGTPPLSVLTRFRELGGRIVTIGSDAHRSADTGAFIENGEDVLRAAGFGYQAFFRNRTPEFFAI